jgi:hypothetical protein
MKLFRTKKQRIRKQREKGVALFIALVALLLLAAIATGMMFQANTESAINYNYRDAQFTYFAAGAGLEDAREMLRTDNIFSPVYTPKGRPSSSNNRGIIYVLNPKGTETVAPWDTSNAYFDDEICHEYPDELGIADTGVNVPCTSGPPAGSYSTVTSNVAVNGTPLAGSNSALVYKWVRISLKYNYTLVPSATTTGYPVDAATAYSNPDKLVCWENQSGHEFLLSGLQVPANPTTPQPSEFELAALQQAIDAGLGSPAVIMFGGKGKSTSTSGTTTGTTTSSTTGTTTGTSTTGTTSGTTTGSTSGTTTGSTSGTTTGSTSGTTTGSTSGTTTGTTSGTTTGTTTTGTTTGTTSGTTTTGTTTGTTSGTTTGTTTGGTSGTTGGTTTGRPGYYASLDDCNAINENRFSVYLVTSLAVSKRGAKRMAQYEISRSTFPQIPGGLTFNGPGATFEPPSSTNYSIDGADHATASSTCNPKGTKVHAITAFTGVDSTAIQNTINTNSPSHPENYTGLGTDRPSSMGGPLTPDVVDGSSTDPQTGYVPLAGLTTVKENTDLVDGLTTSADLLVPVPGGTTVTNSDVRSRNSACSTYPMGTTDTSAPLACQGPKITVIQGNAKLTNAGGTGILLVTGNLELAGNLTWDGLVLVIGSGQLVMSGGGTKTINGGVYVANTTAGATLGAVNVDMNGGGNSHLLYDSCKIANATANQSYRVITYREMTY